MRSTIPPRLRHFVDHIPSAETVRARLAENRQEAAFLRRLLKLAVEAEPTQGNMEGAQREGTADE